MSRTQNKAILQHLMSGYTLTPMDALNQFGCLRLAARINDLKADGWPIDATMVKANGKKFAQYSLCQPEPALA